MGARPGLHRPRRQRLHAQGVLRARARRGLRPRPHPPPRAHPPGPEGGPPAPHARDAGQPLPHLQPLRRPRRRRLERARAPTPRPSRGARSPTTTAPSTASGASATRGAVAAVTDALASTELLIADGHHRYETARVYADEIGGEGGHRYVLMCLVALQDPGLTVFPTHRLLTALPDDKRVALRDAIQRDWEMTEVAAEDLQPTAATDGRIKRRLPRRPPPPPAAAHAQGPGDRRRRAPRHARALPPPRHRRARGAAPQAGARHDRGRHLPPPRARLRARHRAGPRAASRPARPRPRSS